MKPIRPIVLTLALTAGTALFLAGCGGGEETGETDTGEARYGQAQTADGGATAEVAGRIAETAETMAVVENPTAEQLEGTREYPLDTCPTSGEALGEMGDPVLLLIGSQQVKLCCKDCLPDVKADPAKILAKLENQ